MADIIEAAAVDVLAPIQQEGSKAAVRGWLAALGDTVSEGDPLVELETDKVTVEVPAPASGTLVEIVVETDQDAAPGAVLGRIGTAAADSSLVPPPPAGGGRRGAARVRARKAEDPDASHQSGIGSSGENPLPLSPSREGRGTPMEWTGEARRRLLLRSRSPNLTPRSACRPPCASCWWRPGSIPLG